MNRTHFTDKNIIFQMRKIVDVINSLSVPRISVSISLFRYTRRLYGPEAKANFSNLFITRHSACKVVEFLLTIRMNVTEWNKILKMRDTMQE